MIKYPNGKSPSTKKSTVKTKRPVNNAANRGMALENDINLTNDYYKHVSRALITKRPTPINVVKVDYEKGAKIIDAYFEKQSTTDYNGVYKGKYLDFEAKSTNNKTSFPLSNITSHQSEHLSNVKKHGGICFFIIEFARLNQIYLLDADIIMRYRNMAERKSLPLAFIQENGIEIKYGLNPRIDYLDAVDQFYKL